MSDERRLTVTEAQDGQRLDVVVAELGISRNRARAHVDAGHVQVDGGPAKPSVRVRAGQQVVLVVPTAGPAAPPPPLPPVRFRDEHLLVLAKPAGLVVHPGAGHEGDTLVDALRAAQVPLAAAGGEHRPGIVHRLDRDTSGLLAVACTDQAHTGLVGALQRREMTRRYVALVDGVPDAPVGRIEAPIGRHPSLRTRFATVRDGKPATTRYRLLAQGQVGERSVALLACTLETGRTHQIRVHLDAIGHPVLGDPVYGPRPRMAAAVGLTRPFLHAGRLAFAHPVTGEGIDVGEPLPDELADVAERSGVGPVDLQQVLTAG